MSVETTDILCAVCGKPIVDFTTVRWYGTDYYHRFCFQNFFTNAPALPKSETPDVDPHEKSNLGGSTTTK